MKKLEVEWFDTVQSVHISEGNFDIFLEKGEIEINYEGREEVGKLIMSTDDFLSIIDQYKARYSDHAK